MNMNTYYYDYFPVTHLTATCCRNSSVGELEGLRSTHFSSFSKEKKKKKNVGKKHLTGLCRSWMPQTKLKDQISLCK